MTEERFEPFAMVEVLNRRGVEFILIGGLAANALGSDVNTNDIDICYQRTPRHSRWYARLRRSHSLGDEDRPW